MEIEEQNKIKWANGINKNTPTYINSENLNKVNIKTQEALSLMERELDNKLEVFEERLVDGDSSDPIVIAHALRGVCDEKGNIIDETYITVDDLNALVEQYSIGDIAVGSSMRSNETLKVTGSIDSAVKVNGESKPIGTRDNTVATTEFVVNIFNEVLNDALE
ncbi:MAG: hypothetical protein J6J36_00880 [Clostridia bacterium]|nr:hypothetical protein [Clostridia bacterium]